MNILCKLGIHNWKCLKKEYIKRYTVELDGIHCVLRKCSRCPKREKLSGILTQEGDIILIGWEMVK